MSKRQYVVLLIVAAVSGLGGGVVASWFLLGSPVFAQKSLLEAEDLFAARKPTRSETVLRVERFEVVDRAGKTRAVLGTKYSDSTDLRGGPSLELYDQDGKPRAALGYNERELARTGATENRGETSLVLFDKEGRVLWHAP